MAFAFDTLGYAKKLRNAGVPQDQAEAHAEAAREFVMAELVTRHDLEVVRNDLDGRIAAVRSDLQVMRRELDGSIAAVRHDLEGSIAALRKELESSIDRLSLRLTVRMGVMLAAAIAVLATINRL
jgi:hypothetical protein